MGDQMNFSRTSSHDNAFNGGPVGAAASTGTTPWPLFDAAVLCETAHASNALVTAEHTYQIEATEDLAQNADDSAVPTKRRPSVLRLFTGLSRLRRSDTGDASDLTSPTRLEAHTEDDVGEDSPPEPSEDVVEAYIRRHARK